ncbi:MAG: hypothetical protein ABJO01_15040 [Parasphingorhabdus sp.]|uniref:hypothetical protein n=1 Tax=Parasphingorhabdus sp. TaxID=2709688 RepID=UPI003296FA66
MIKKAILFIASAGLLVFFVMPVDENEQPETAAAEKPKTKPVNVVNSADSWEADGEEGEEETIFGEPVAYSENDKVAEEYEVAGTATKVASDASFKSAPKNYISPSVYNKQPEPGGLGSPENPIDMTPGRSRQ